MTKYHSDDYIKFLRSIRPDNMSEYSKQMQRCEYFPFTGSHWLCRRSAPLFPSSCFAVNVGEDCPVFDGLFEFCQLSVGGSVGEWKTRFAPMSAIFSTGGLTIVVAFSWGCEVEQTADGHCHQLGWRPPPRQEVRGLGILLRQRHSSGYSGTAEVGFFHWWALEFPRVEPNLKIVFSQCLMKELWFIHVTHNLVFTRYHQRVLYIDIDIHHGDGVEEAFYTTDRVMTVSFHKYGEYFPGTGDLRVSWNCVFCTLLQSRRPLTHLCTAQDIGAGKGKYYAVNYPLRDGIDDESYEAIFKPVSKLSSRLWGVQKQACLLLKDKRCSSCR